MPPTIRIDERVYEALKERAEPFVDTPNSVLLKMLGLTADTRATELREQGDVPDEPPGPKTSRVTSSGRTRRGSGRRPKHRKSAKSRTSTRERAPRGSLLPSSSYELPILAVLVGKGGRAPSREVVDGLEQRLDGRLNSVDQEKTSTGEVRWRNRAHFVRLHLVEQGDMVRGSPRGVWEITEEGRRRVAQREDSNDRRG